VKDKTSSTTNPKLKASILERMVILLWSLVWRHWLLDGHTGKYCKVVRVKGWRTALVDSPSKARMTITPMFKWEAR